MNRYNLSLTLGLVLTTLCVDAETKKHGDFAYNEFVYIPIEKIIRLKLGEETFERIESSFGKKIYAETIYGDYTLPIKIEGNYYPVDRIVSYFGTLSNKSEKDDGKNIIRKIQTDERQTVSLFFYRNQLIDFSVYQEVRIGPKGKNIVLGKNATKDVLEKHRKRKGHIGWLWPEAYCDGKYYYTKSGQLEKLKEDYWVAHAEPCAWESPDFENELKKDGYYERKKEMDSGDFSYLKKVQAKAKKWVEVPGT
ncbi:hypothetical protein CH373_03000 [Leptospira perolatii]|uniref:Uncharacterized protein n=1 Tax=Leptospira perolatii TaxID=2023191 RepID=A0A2M9ZSR5_9LEPT|nr:hypothetical protein [Leptospira perolatii]PJZ71474.1 hypothetical protein CH360_02995 [Leptospira perolatii]PJZ75009.1 hypothetical protein CH373_03000 [Leptospira perolatii]